MSKSIVWNLGSKSQDTEKSAVLWASKRGRKSSKTNSEKICKIHAFPAAETERKTSSVVLEEERLLASLENEDRLLRASEVIKKLGISRTTLYRLIEKGIIPKPLHLGSKIIVWPLSQINALIAGL